MRTRTLAGAAAGIGAVTALARVVGFGRTAVLTRTLGPGCVGDAYQTANQLPNVVFEVVAGGALAALVVPLLAGAVAVGDRDTAGRTASALLTWTVVVLVPIAVLGALVAPAALHAVAGSSPRCGRPLLEVGVRMLRVFMPQVVLYGVGIVLTGVLQAHRRFLGPALAPLLSSAVVIGAYLAYAGQGRVPLDRLSGVRELTLSVGTTLGVGALALPLLLPLRRCGLPLRPTLSFPPGVAARARSLAAGGVAGLAAQQLALLVALRLANGGNRGDVVVFLVATACFLLPWAVLAVPVATSAFPELSAAAQTGDHAAYARVAGGALRALLVLTAGAAGLLVAVAGPAARVLVLGAPGPDRVEALTEAVRAFAPGLLGYGVLALLGRALYARGDARTPATATVTGWLVVALADVALVQLGVGRVVALGLGNSIGMTVAGLLLVAGLRRACPPALAGTSRTALVSLAAGTAVAALALLLRVDGGATPGGALLIGSAVALAATALYAGAVRLLDPAGLRALARG